MSEYKQEDLLRDLAIVLTLKDDQNGTTENRVLYESRSRVNRYAWKFIREEVAAYKYEQLKDQIEIFEQDYGPYLKKSVDKPKI